MRMRAERMPQEVLAPKRVSGDSEAAPPETARDSMAEAFASDFGNERFTDMMGAGDRGLGAEAFNPGGYDPSTPSGHEMVGHEMAHVVQQREGRAGAPGAAAAAPEAAAAPPAAAAPEAAGAAPGELAGMAAGYEPPPTAAPEEEKPQ